VGAFLHELFRVGLYKKSQGRVARQATFAALAIIVALAAWRLSAYSSGMDYLDPETKRPNDARFFVNVYAVPLALLALGMWASFRIVQMPNFADFLISVEGEMNKVSWPSRSELFRASLVVMFVIFFLAGILFLYDYLLTWGKRFVVWALNLVFGI
jgi:preprotein translocase subunit SecE